MSEDVLVTEHEDGTATIRSGFTSDVVRECAQALLEFSDAEDVEIVELMALATRVQNLSALMFAFATIWVRRQCDINEDGTAGEE